ncbi:MmgE/PrpD family protein [Aquabacter spiritensis]|uniref:2-methylcitrate dehydratase PrpD n=1 Tax=Aquabacter spiritensis TaxID=933073 RepID=A0A4R3M3H5_9HYPH|nr:MmgE/PrpD family protein [Aquabacter spiritensis]TCT06779.1 2-methylcitrate dehydratase PrpD [Aquabacter spiritensis]
MAMKLALAPDPIDDSEGLSARLCAEIATWRYEDLPPDVVRTVKLFLVDTFGVIAGAARAPGIAEVRGRFARWETDGSATALIGKNRLSPPHAALVNGACAHALDFDDIHDPARVHTFCVMLPTMLATAEDIGGVDGKRLILALAIGAELHARLGLAAYNCLGKGWHPTMVLGVLAGALGAGSLLGLDGTGLLNALGLALHQASGTAQPMHDGVLAKRLGAGFAARGAVTAAFLAKDGVTGPFRPLEGEAGLFPFLERGEVRIGDLMDGLGEEWRLRDYSFKPFPCCRCTHTAIGLGFELRRLGVRPEEIAAVEIALGKVNHQTVGQPYEAKRDSVVHAQFNVAYTFARALTDGKVDLATFTRPAITDPAIATLAEKVVAIVDPGEAATDMAPARITVTRTDGSVQTVASRIIPGSPDAPLSEADIVGKFEGCAAFGLGLGAAAARPFAERLLALEDLPDSAVLARDFPN